MDGGADAVYDLNLVKLFNCYRFVALSDSLIAKQSLNSSVSIPAIQVFLVTYKHLPIYFYWLQLGMVW